jgi:cysteine desulfurase
VESALTYLDHAATTPMRPEAVAAMAPFLQGTFGNPSGGHAAARAAKTALEEAREEIAELLAVRPAELVFTAGGTEADNLAVKGVARRARATRGADGVVTTAFEHKGVLASCDRLAAEGFRIEAVSVPESGVVDVDRLLAAVDERTAVVSVMLVNNEVGTVQSLDGLDAPLVHTDAVQALPWLDVATAAARADLISVSAHKVGGPQGVGALVVREGVCLAPLLRGGGQERERRSGTQNVAGIAGFAAAVRACRADPPDVAGMRDRLAAGLTAIPGCRPSVDLASTVPGILSLLFDDVESEALLVLLDRAGVCASAASSCASGAMESSHVLRTLGLPTGGSLRLSLGWTTTDAEIDHALAVVPAAVAQLRGHARDEHELGGAA